jgi:hypothetical protein
VSNRGLLILLAVTILVALAAALGLREQAPEVAGGQGERLFPQLAGQLDGVREVSLEAAEGGKAAPPCAWTATPGGLSSATAIRPMPARCASCCSS